MQQDQEITTIVPQNSSESSPPISHPLSSSLQTASSLAAASLARQDCLRDVPLNSQSIDHLPLKSHDNDHDDNNSNNNHNYNKYIQEEEEEEEEEEQGSLHTDTSQAQAISISDSAANSKVLPQGDTQLLISDKPSRHNELSKKNRHLNASRPKLSITRGLSRSLGDAVDYTRPQTNIFKRCGCENISKLTLCLTISLLIIALVFAILGIIESTDNVGHSVAFFVVSALFLIPGLCQLATMYRKRKMGYGYGRMK